MTPVLDMVLPYQWTPRPYQVALWNYLIGGGTRAVARWHRRSGKDDVLLRYTCVAAHQRVGNYWYMLPEYAQARKSMWDAVNPHTGRRRIDEAFPQILRADVGGTREQEMMIRFENGSTFQLVGSDNFNSLVGSPPVGLVFSEYALSNPTAWGYLRPIVLENKGWAVFNSTPRGANHFKALCEMAETTPGWFSQTLTAEQTGVFTPQQLDDELHELQAEHGEQYGRSLWLQEYFCSFDAAIPGSIWGDAVDRAVRDGRVVDYAVDPRRPVYTAWDLGRTDDTAIWWYQFNGTGIDVFDHFSSAGMDIENPADVARSLVHVLLQKAVQYGTTYATHWLPHDARPRTLAAGGKSILQQFDEAVTRHPTLGRFAIGPRLDIQEGIQAARATFPYCRFHQTRTKKGVESLRSYHRVWDTEKRMFLDHPEHDRSSHDADAFRYLSLSWRRPKGKAPAEAPLEARLLAGSPGHLDSFLTFIYKKTLSV